MFSQSFAILDIDEVDFPSHGFDEPGWIKFDLNSGSSTAFKISNRTDEIFLFAPEGALNIDQAFEFENGAVCLVRGGYPILIQPNLTVTAIQSLYNGLYQLLRSDDQTTLACLNYSEVVSLNQTGIEWRFTITDLYDVELYSCTSSRIVLQVAATPGGRCVPLEIETKD